MAVAREHGLRVDEPVVLNDRFSVQVHLAPVPVVAGISTAELRPDITDWLARKVAVTDHLEAVGAPVVGNSRELPPGPHERDGLAMTFTTWTPPDADRTPGAADCVAMLPDLHVALATYRGELPLLAPVHQDIPRGLAALVRNPDVLTSEERATGGELRWIDFEDVCRGPVGYDLALLRWMNPTAGDGWAEPEQLALCSDLRAVYLASCMVAFRDVFGDDPEWDGYIRWFVSRISS